jgi:death-on-curing family protein
VNSIELYKSLDGETQIEVKFEKETVWLNINQISELFGRDKSVISRHLKNLYAEQELDYSSTVAKNATVQMEGKRRVERVIEFFNLDVIISIGYRVNSKQGTQFRIWATNRIKEYLIQGYSANQKRLEELSQLIQIIEKSEENDTRQLDETKGLLEILRNYTKSFILLNQYDSDSVEFNSIENNVTYEIKYEEAIQAIKELKKQLIEKKEAADLFGKQKDQSFSGILKSVTQTFGSEYLYPTIEEQASNLLYFIIKNHPFSDGNKRIGALIFIWFLEKNKHLRKKTGESKINDNALTALALLVAQSNPDEKELMIKLICNLLI